MADPAPPRRPYHLDDQLSRFWGLQRLARNVSMRLTSDGDRLHLRDADGKDHVVANLDVAEREIGGAQ
jgi:hypothetical protein